MERIGTQIDIQLKGSRDLLKFTEGVKKLTKSIEHSADSINKFQRKNELVLKSVNNLNSTLSATKKNFNDVALGTRDATQAARQYLTATTEVNAALAAQKAAVISLQNSRKSDAYFLAQSARAGKANALAEKQSAQQSVEIARARNIEIQAQLRNQELAKEVQTRAPRLPAFQERGLRRLENFRSVQDELERKKELKKLEKEANRESKKRLNVQEQTNKKVKQEVLLGRTNKKNQKLINASFEDRVKFAEKNGKIRRANLQRANALLLVEQRTTEQKSKQNIASAFGLKGRTIGQGLQGGLSNALIGGGFPLLFGQGAAASIGGGLGGLIGGGLLGGGFGFALSIIGTAIGSAVAESNKFNKSLNQLNNRLLAVGGTSRITAKDFKELRKAIGGNKDETLQLIGELNRFGAGGVDVGKALGKDADKIITSIASITGDESTLVKALTDNVNTLGIARVKELAIELKGLSVQEQKNKLLKEFQNIQGRLNLKRNETTALENFEKTGSPTIKNENPFILGPSDPGLQGAINLLSAQNKLKKTKDLNIAPQLQAETDLQNLINPPVSNKTDLNKEKLQNDILKTRIGLIKTESSLLDEGRVSLERRFINQKAALSLIEAQGDEQKQVAIVQKRINDLSLLDAQVSAAQTGEDKRRNELITNTMEKLEGESRFLKESLTMGVEKAQIERQIRDIVKIVGKEREGEVRILIQGNAAQREKLQLLAEEKAMQQQIQGILAGGMTNAVMGLIDGTKTLGQALADVAKQLASMFLNRAFMGFFGGMFGGGGGMSAGGYYSSTTGLGIAGPNFGLADGGYVNSASLKMIGEGGEPEYVIPSSKMSGAMARYSAGARGGAVIPGGSGASGTVAGSSGNTIVEYTGPVLNFNGDEYVPKSAVPEIINTAAKRGGESGRAQAFSALKNSRSQRATLGL